MILDMSGALEEGVDEVGGKAFALAEAAAFGAPVPEFFVVTAEEAGQSAVLSETARASIIEEVKKILAKGATLFAVRSSARLEDSAAASHAGQFLTCLNQNIEEICHAVEAVFKSGLESHVSEYRNSLGLSGSEFPAVVIQRQIDAVCAGVAFSADPVSGRRDRIVISAIEGLGEKLVSGEEDGEYWQIGKAKPDIFLRPDNNPILSEEQAKEIAALARMAEKRKHFPQDIEWAIDKQGKLWHLQNRPITSRLLPIGHGETKLTVLDNSNIVESYPGFVSPLTFSFASQAYERVYRAFLSIVGTPAKDLEDARAMLANMLVFYRGRMYYNLGNWYQLLSFLPFFSKNRSNMETMMGLSSPIPDEAISSVSAPSVFSLIRMVGFLGINAALFPHMRKKFYRRMEHAMQANSAGYDLNSMTLSELGREYRRLEAALLDRWDAPILNDVLCMMAYGGSRKYLERHAGKDGIRLHNDVMIGQGDIISAEPAKLIKEAGQILLTCSEKLKEAVAKGNQQLVFADPLLGPKLKAYIAKFGDRRIGELKLESPTLEDDPTPLFAAVNAASVTTPITTKTTDSVSLDQLFSGKRLKKYIASFLLSYAKARVKDRENLRFERTRIFAQVRRIFLAIGRELSATGQIDKPEDIFFLELNEVLGSVEGFTASHDLLGLVNLRKTEDRRNKARADPGDRILIRGTIGDGGARIVDNIATSKVETRTDDTERQGIACGTGKVKARARIIRDPLTTQLQKGEILVAVNTDPGWISHFVNASGVVVERGSILSHSAIVSRELGIACVVGVKGACTWLKDGDLVEVDGGEGIVRKCDA